MLSSFYDFKRQFEKAVKGARLERVTSYILRHTSASDMIMSRIDLPTVREILRHKDSSMTLRYAHLSPGHKNAAVEALGNALNSGGQSEARTA